LDTLRIARDLSEGNVFSHEQAERLGNAFATYWAEVRSELVTREHLDARLAQLEAKFEARLAQLEAKFDTRFARLEAKLDGDLVQLEARLESKLETSLASVQNKIVAAQVALFVLLGVAIYLK
jgi:DNA anti-recombination protein RmuC